MTALTIDELIRDGRFEAAVARMQDACRIYDPTVPIDVDAVRARYEATRAQLKALVPPAPFRIVVELVTSVAPGGAS